MDRDSDHLDAGISAERPNAHDLHARDEAYARVRAKAVETLGSAEKADEWLVIPNRALGGRPPMAMLDTKEGAQEVVNVLGRIDWGVFE